MSSLYVSWVYVKCEGMNERASVKLNCGLRENEVKWAQYIDLGLTEEVGDIMIQVPTSATETQTINLSV